MSFLKRVLLCLGAKEFASEALKATSEYAQAGDILQEKVPEAIEGMTLQSVDVRSISLFICLIAAGRGFAAKAVEVGQEYGKEALDKTEKYAEKVLEAGKEKAEGLLKDAKKKLDL
jgi:hypothetical protein